MKGGTIITLVIFIILLISIPIYLYKYKEVSNSFNYNGYTIYKTPNNFYNIEIYLKEDTNPHYLSSRYNPSDLEYIYIDSNVKENLFKDEIYITLSEGLTTTSVVALAEISKVTANQFLYNIPTHSALAYHTPKNSLFKNCEDATSNTAIILLRTGNETSINLADKCVIISGKDENEIIKASTRLTLTMLGVMKPF